MVVQTRLEVVQTRLVVVQTMKHVFLFNVAFLLQLCKTTPIVAKR